MGSPADDDWEYEYDDVETEDFYIPIDMSNVPRGQKQVESERRTGHPTLLKSRLRALNAQRGQQQQDATMVDSANGHELGILGEAQVTGLHTADPLIMYNGQLLSLQWASTIGTDLFFARPDSDANPAEKPLRSLPNVDLLAMSSTKLVARVARLRPRDDLFENAGEAEGATSQTDGNLQESAEVSQAPADSFLARFNAAKAKRGDSTRLLVSKIGAESNLVAEAVAATPEATRSDAAGEDDIDMSGT